MGAPEQLALPFSVKEAVSLRRASTILGVSTQTIYRMLDAQTFQCLRRGETSIRLIRWSSIVEYCDDLRTTYNIPNRRPVLSNPLFRYADRDIPPFPLDQTMYADEIGQILQFEKSKVLNLAENGDLEAYHLFGNSPWRFYRPSVARFIADIHLRSAARRRMVRG